MAFYMVYLLYQLQEVIFYDGKAKRTNPEYGYIHQARKKGLELLGVQGYTAIREYQNNAMKKDSVMRKKQTALYVDRENI